MINYFILIVSDTNNDDGWDAISAHELALGRLRAGRWPIYPRTRNRATICTGDQCLVYVGGKGKNAQCIIGAAEVDGLLQDSMWLEPACAGRTEPIALTLKLTDQSIFGCVVPIRPFLGRLSFVTNVTTWGGAFQGGCRRILKEDFELLKASVIETPEHILEVVNQLS